MSDRKTVAVVPTYLTISSDVEVLADCLRTLRQTAPDAEVLVVDDGSPAPELVDASEALAQDLSCDLHRKEENDGFAAAVNVGLRRALNEGKDAVLVNADIEFIDGGWLDVMRSQARQESDGLAWVVGALLLYPQTGLIQHAGVYFALLERCFEHRFKYGPGDLPDAMYARTCPVTAALQFIRLECLQTVGVYDEGFRLGWEDMDYCLRVFAAGQDCVYQPKVRAWHAESMFRGRPSPKLADWQQRSLIYLHEKWAQRDFLRWTLPVG